MQALPDFDALRSNYFEFILGVFYRTHTIAIAFQTDDYSLCALVPSSGDAKPNDAVPAMCSRYYLHVMFLGSAQHEPPKLGLQRVMDAVLGLVDKKEAVGRIR